MRHEPNFEIDEEYVEPRRGWELAAVWLAAVLFCLTVWVAVIRVIIRAIFG
jgi:hypothetical protein